MAGHLKTVCAVLFLVGLSGCQGRHSSSNGEITLRVGHVAHDHHLALYVALDHAGRDAGQTGISVRAIRDREYYELFDGDRKLANLQIVVVGGGARMPTALAQGIIDVGLGGAAAILAACDRGAPVRLIAPLHSKGDMLVVRPDLPVESWQDFVALIAGSPSPLRVGYKSPMAVAKLVLEDALRHERIPFGGDLSRADLGVHLINVKEDGALNTSLSQGLIDAYVGNNPFPAIAQEMGIGKIVCELDQLPPGRFRNHPCCCIAANIWSLSGKEEAVAGLLVLLLRANETIHGDPDSAVRIACRWLGTSEAVQRASIPTSGYSLEPDAQWHRGMEAWFRAMNELDVFQGQLKDLAPVDAAAVAYEFSFLQQAQQQFEPARRQD
jgi:NitT/TauT family transport system substrate-binding protein